jgi:ornithine carbamoyltransferase
VFMVRHFLGQNDLDAHEIEAIFRRTAELKVDRQTNSMSGRSLVMLFEKTSTRTRLSFEIGMTQLGGHAVYLDLSRSQIAVGESLADTARVITRYADVLMARVNHHTTVQELSEFAGIPVINGLSDREHPCQSMADLFTMQECRGALNHVSLCYIGDANNNVTHSLMLGATRVGARMVVACPPEYAPDEEFIAAAQRNAEKSGGQLQVTDDPGEAVRDADFIYADAWISMGKESEAAARVRALTPYQVNGDLVRHARPDYIFMHCLPAHIGQEVTDEVAYGPHSVIFDQAENRLHVQKALIEFLVQSDQRETRE